MLVAEEKVSHGPYRCWLVRAHFELFVIQPRTLCSHIHGGASTFGYELSWFPHGPCSKNVLGGSLVHLASALGVLV